MLAMMPENGSQTHPKHQRYNVKPVPLTLSVNRPLPFIIHGVNSFDRNHNRLICCGVDMELSHNTMRQKVNQAVYLQLKKVESSTRIDYWFFSR